MTVVDSVDLKAKHWVVMWVAKMVGHWVERLVKQMADMLAVWKAEQ